MARRSCDGEGLLGAFQAAVANLETHVDEINALNVYPVPDGDTGSNMYATVKAALDEAEAASDRLDRTHRGRDQLRGADGRARQLGGHHQPDLPRHGRGVGREEPVQRPRPGTRPVAGAKTAYGAVAKPVEGTILTVIRESADAAVKAAERDNDIETVLTATVAAAEKSVARTPSLLAILREAGVVDSGGQGIYRLFQGALLHLVGQSPAGAARERSHAGSGVKPSTLVAHADEGFGYETMFLLQPNGSGGLDVDAIRDHLESIGESVLVAGDRRALKIHVHNERPDLVIGFGLSVGALSRISIENLDNQARDIRETRAAAFTSEAPAGAPAATDAVASAAPVAAPALGVVAVVAGDGLAAIFRDFGVAAVVQGGQSANPSTGELLAAIAAVDAVEIIVLPNNPNVVLAARQVASMTDRPVTVVPTRNAAEGFAALLALEPGLDAAANAGPMGEAARAIQTLVVTEAVRDATIGGRKVKRGQTIALGPDDGLLAAGNDREKAVLDGVAAFAPGFELSRCSTATAPTWPRRRRWHAGSVRRRAASRSRSATADSRSTGT